MKYIRCAIILFVAILWPMIAMAQGSDALLRDKITDAVMKVYDEQLAKDPNDYNTLFARAHQHFYNGEYTAAIADVNQAMLLTPKTDKELRFDEHVLRARISDARRDYNGALADLRMAQELQPKSLACTDLIAKINLKAGNLDAAEKAFKTILRSESMNYDAMYGLAQVEQARGNSKGAIEQATKAVDLFRVEPQVYVNRADIYTRQGNVDAAIKDLLKGMSVGDGGTAAKHLFDLSDIHYDDVMNSLATMADMSADQGGLYRYLRANIAIDHSRYGQALRDLNYIKRNGLYENHTLYYNLAKSYLELARFDEALAAADQALNRDPSQPEYYLVKALAEYNVGEGGRFDEAMEVLNRCSTIAPQYVPMLIAKASLLSSVGKDKEALGYLNAAVANEPGDAEALLARAAVLKRLNYMRLSLDDYNTLTRLSDDVYDLKGFGLNEMGRDNDALRWLQHITSVNQPGGENFYYAALFMAQRGDNFKAMEYLQKAIDLGYGSRYHLQFDELSPVNLKALRTDPSFDLLMDKAQRNFTERY